MDNCILELLEALRLQDCGIDEEDLYGAEGECRFGWHENSTCSPKKALNAFEYVQLSTFFLLLSFIYVYTTIWAPC